MAFAAQKQRIIPTLNSYYLCINIFGKVIRNKRIASALLKNEKFRLTKFIIDQETGLC